MRRVMIYAYTANNFGDDLFIHILCLRYPNTGFILYAPKNYVRTFAHIPNLTIIPSDSLLHKLSRLTLRPFNRQFILREKIARKCDAAVYIGGSLFMEVPGWESEVNNIKSMMREESPFFVIGANFGPFTTQYFYDTYEMIFNKCTDICFRDKQSYELFRHLPTVRQASDVVFQLTRTEQLESKKHIIISVIYPSIRPHLKHLDDVYFQQIARISETYVQVGYKVILCAFCKIELDEKAIKRIFSRIPRKFHPLIHTHTYETNINKTVQLFAQAKAVIATRFHAMILGLLFHKPTFPIVYSDKMTTVLEDIGFSGTYWPIEQIERIDTSEIIHFAKNRQQDITAEINSAHKQFLSLDQWLKK